MENPIKMDDLGVPLFLETPTLVNNQHLNFLGKVTIPPTYKSRGRPAVAVRFFNDFTLKKSTVVGLQAS